MNFTIRVYGADEATANIVGYGQNAANARPALEEIHLTMLDIEQEAFEKEGARDGFPRWRKLAISTIVRKVKRKMNPKILHETERLMKAMTTYRSSDAYTKIEKDRIIFQPKMTTLPYGRIHQKGGHAGGHVIDARPFIRFSEKDAAAFGRELQRHIMKKKRTGRIQTSFE